MTAAEHNNPAQAAAASVAAARITTPRITGPRMAPMTPGRFEPRNSRVAPLLARNPRAAPIIKKCAPSVLSFRAVACCSLVSLSHSMSPCFPKHGLLLGTAPFAMR